MLIFKSIRWKNFLSYGNVFTELNLQLVPKTLIVGANGSGKSTLLDALVFVLFGKPYRNIPKSKLVNSINNRGCLVEIELESGSRRVLVKRGISPNIFEIYINGELVNQESKKDYQTFLEENILGFGLKTFKQVVLLGSAGFIPFMKLSPKDRDKVVSDILGLDIFAQMSKVLHERTDAAVSLLTRVNLKIDNKKEKVEDLRANVETIAKSLNQNVQMIETQIESNRNKISQCLSQKDDFQKIIDKLSVAVSAKQKILDEISSYKFQLKTINYEIKRLEKDRDFFRDHDVCPTCTQKISGRIKQDKLNYFGNKIESKKKKIGLIKSCIKALESKLPPLDAKVSEINSLQNKINELDSLLSSSQKWIKSLERERNQMRAQSAMTLQDAKKELDREINNLKNLENSKNKLEKMLKIYNLCETMLKRDGIPATIIKYYLPLINKLINDYLSQMGLFVKFQFDEYFQETIKSRYRDFFVYDSFSEGEKHRIDLALLFTWREVARMKNSVNTNLFIVDEIFDSSLEPQGTEDFLKIVDGLRKTNLFVISHRGDIFDDKFDGKITMKKQKDFSYISDAVIG